MSLKNSPKILVYVGLDLLGDGLMKLSFLKALRGLYPNAHITWFAGKGKTVFATTLAPIVKGLLDEVRDGISYGTYFREIFKSRPFKKEIFDIIIDTQSRVKTTLLLKRIPHRLFISGAAHFLFSDKKPSQRKQKPLHLQERLLDLVRLLKGDGDTELNKVSISIPEKEEKLALKLLPDSNYVGLVPGAGGRQKCWPLENYIALAHRIKEKKQEPVFILGPQEKEWEERLKQEVPFALFPLQEKAAVKDLSFHLTLALGKRLQAAVSNDCGTGHLLAAVDTPLVSLFGPTNAEKFSPFTSELVLLQAQQWGGCEMQKIPVDAVGQALFDLLQRVKGKRNE